MLNVIRFTNRTAACFAVLLMALFSVGCASEPRQDALAVSDEMAPAAERALGRWSAATGLVLQLADDGIPVELVSELECDEGCIGGTRVKLPELYADRIQVWDGLDEDGIEWVLAHEFGHVLMRAWHGGRDANLAHSADEDSLLGTYGVGMRAPITAQLLAEVCSVQACAWERPEVTAATEGVASTEVE